LAGGKYGHNRGSGAAGANPDGDLQIKQGGIVKKTNCIGRLFGAALVAAALAQSPAATAQSAYPSQPIKIVVPYLAGGGVDIIARLLGEQWRTDQGWNVIVDNKPGAAGMIGTQFVSRAPADGYTLLMSASGEIVVTPHLYKKQMAYDPDKDLQPITLMVKVPNVLVINNDIPANNIAELVAYARANPGKLSFSSSGIGNSQHLAGELFNKMAGTQIIHVPYKGAAQQLTDVAAKQVSMTFVSIASALPLIKSGQVKAIAVTSKERVAALPDTPALTEFKPLAGYELENWFGFFAPAGIPAPVLAKLSEAAQKALRNPEFAKKLRAQGGEPTPYTPEAFRAFVRAESAKFQRIIVDANVTLEK
jgi:tripartite-type tricarboxylate transporter receptor subunit TctC